MALARATGTASAARRHLSPVTRSILFLSAAYLILFAALSWLAPNFTSEGNLLNILRQISMIGISGVGLTAVIVAAEIDLSVGSIAAFSGVCLAYLAVRWGLPLPPAVAAALAIGALAGVVTASLRVLFRIPTFITSLALLTALRSGAFLVSGGFPISPMPPGFEFWGNGWIGPLPAPFALLLAIAGVGWFVMARTTLGRAVYAVGGNEEAARLSGINVPLVKLGVFAASGALAATAGVLFASRLSSGTPTVAQGMELDVIAAVIIGGTSLFGGAGSVVGTLLGALFMATLRTGMVLIGVSPYSQGVISGMVIVLAVLLGAVQPGMRR
jgi:sugar transport system permease protein